MRRILMVVFFGGWCCFSSISAWAQAGVNTGNIAGTATDASGAAIADVTVEASSPALIEKVSNNRYRLQRPLQNCELASGHLCRNVHQGWIQHPPARRDRTDRCFHRHVNAAMQMGSVSQTVTVTGESPVIDTQDTVVQQTLSNNVVESLPLGGSAAVYTSVGSGRSRNSNQPGRWRDPGRECPGIPHPRESDGRLSPNARWNVLRHARRCWKFHVQQ